MLTIRIDDVMVNSSSMNREKALRQMNKLFVWLATCPDKVHGMPTIIIDEMAAWPEIIDRIKKEMVENNVTPQLHGWSHVDYGAMPQHEIEEHLDKSITWFAKTFGIEPAIWATPWGAYNDTILAAAERYQLIVQGVQGTITPGQAMKFIRQTGTGDCLKNQTIMCHWYDRGINLIRVIETINHGSLLAAKAARTDFSWD